MKKKCHETAAKVALGTSSRDLQEVLRGFPCTLWISSISETKETQSVSQTLVQISFVLGTVQSQTFN